MNRIENIHYSTACMQKFKGPSIEFLPQILNCINNTSPQSVLGDSMAYHIWQMTDKQTNKKRWPSDYECHKTTDWYHMHQELRISYIRTFPHILHLKDYCKPWAQREFVLQNAILEEDKSLNGFIDTSRKTKNHMRMLLFSQNI